VRMWGGEDARRWGCEELRMWGCDDVRRRGCDEVKMWGEDVRMSGCQDVRRWRCEDVGRWGCEEVGIWGCEDVGRIDLAQDFALIAGFDILCWTPSLFYSCPSFVIFVLSLLPLGIYSYARNEVGRPSFRMWREITFCFPWLN
jgi:hypothetical protein